MKIRKNGMLADMLLTMTFCLILSACGSKTPATTTAAASAMPSIEAYTTAAIAVPETTPPPTTEEETEPETEEVKIPIFVTSSDLNVREGAGTKYDVITTVSNGVELVLTGNEQSTSSGSTWLEVELPDSDKTGWVSSKYGTLDERTVIVESTKAHKAEETKGTEKSAETKATAAATQAGSGSSGSSGSKSAGSVSFTNKYGTPTTKCVHSGCNNFIATSGDTNCCTTHSRRCGECGCYIDEDALFCMSCLTKAAGKSSSGSSSSSGGSKSSSSSGGSKSSSSKKTTPETGAGGYEMPNENDKSFADYVKRVDPDLYKQVFGN